MQNGEFSTDTAGIESEPSLNPQINGVDRHVEVNGHDGPKSSVQPELHPTEPPGTEANELESPPRKRRKLHEADKLLKQISPPWKRVAVEGPTSFVEDGRRKSSRTNNVPLDLQPKGTKVQTRASARGSRTIKFQRQDGPQSSIGSPRGNVKYSRGRGRGGRGYHGQTQRARTLSTTSTSKGAQINGWMGKSKDAPLHYSIPKRPYRRKSLIHHKTSGQRRSTRSSDDIVDEKTPSTPYENTKTSIIYSPYTPGSANPPRLRLKFNRPPIPVLNPKHLVPSKKHPSLREWLENDDALEGEDESRWVASRFREEARLLNKLEDSILPNGVLSADNRALRPGPSQPEPTQQYGHLDHLLGHVKDFQPRLDRERKEHMFIAKRLAHAALAKWKTKHKTEEQMLLEAQDAQRILVKRSVRELQQKWDFALTEAKKKKLEMWEQEEQARGTRELDSILEKKTKLLVERRRRHPSLPEGEHDQDSLMSVASEDNSVDSIDEDSEDDDDDMSESSGSDEASAGEEGGDDELTAEELRKKYENLPNMPSPEQGNCDSKGSGGEGEALHGQDVGFSDFVQPDDTTANDLNSHALIESAHNYSQVELEQVADELLDDTSQDTSDSGTPISSSEEDDSEVSDEAGEEEEEAASLLGFFSKVARSKLVEVETESTLLPTTNAKDHLDDTNVKAVLPNLLESTEQGDQAIESSKMDLDPSDANFTSGAPSNEVSPAANTTNDHSEADSATSLEPNDNEPLMDERSVIQSSPVNKIKIPHLLRGGTLREYQHYGLEWLAGLYENGTNGILADEMGLGKTIQTIALLAHLATEHEIWGPHLIVVPTSVMLNWEMEFKKWCPGFKIMTYYGTQSERLAKRKGWTDENAWHVCITSYQLALQDVSSLKRRNWHYMVLDEAHNIKNFRSKRWETLLNFKTAARLLLTGTPLQNNLTELWSLLFFISPPDENGEDAAKFGDLEEFNRMFKRPADAILDHGRDAMDETAKKVVAKLHEVLRPHLLRRLKADVEKQMPGKYEHVVYCRLSKRQRQLYDGYMRRADTRESLASGNYMSMINCLMQLRKVCNHPDLFETRPIVTSFAMKKSAIAEYEIKELLLRRRLLDSDTGSFLNHPLCLLTSHESLSKQEAARSISLAASHQLDLLTEFQSRRIPSEIEFDGSSPDMALNCLEITARQSRLHRLSTISHFTQARAKFREVPFYGRRLLEILALDQSPILKASDAAKRPRSVDDLSDTSSTLRSLVPSISQRAGSLETLIQKFGCVTPAAVAPNMSKLALTHELYDISRSEGNRQATDPFHEARVRLSIAFPDKSLIQYDCGKLQRLAVLLRNLEAGGHRALIFTQMTKVLDVLEQFLNLHGHKYLRLDGSTKIEQRQILTDRFNNDKRILAFILSSRSGGIGINLTGADTVIFYDLDWNPAMDKQCQDRCHRIGQTRDVHIYRFVSQGTIEGNILRKSNQKRMLDDVFIQEGEFTTDHFNQIDLGDLFQDPNGADAEAEAEAALDKVLGGPEKTMGKVLEQVEDQEDAIAARAARKEGLQNNDAADFEGEAPAAPGSTTTGTPRADAPATPTTSAAVATPAGPTQASTPIPPAEPVTAPAAPSTPAIHEWAGVSIASRLAETSQERDDNDDRMDRSWLTNWAVPMQLWELRGIVIMPAGERAKRAKLARKKKGADAAAARIRR